MSPLYYGPRQASWEIVWSDSSGTTVVSTLGRARATLANFHREGRTGTPTITRVEYCPVPDCDGHGEITRRTRRHTVVSRSTCSQCELLGGPFRTVEDLRELEPLRVPQFWSLAETLRFLGFELAGRTVTRRGATVFRGDMVAVWLWLRETGLIL